MQNKNKQLFFFVVFPLKYENHQKVAKLIKVSRTFFYSLPRNYHFCIKFFFVSNAILVIYLYFFALNIWSEVKPKFFLSSSQQKKKINPFSISISLPFSRYSQLCHSSSSNIFCLCLSLLSLCYFLHCCSDNFCFFSLSWYMIIIICLYYHHQQSQHYH